MLFESTFHIKSWMKNIIKNGLVYEVPCHHLASKVIASPPFKVTILTSTPSVIFKATSFHFIKFHLVWELTWHITKLMFIFIKQEFIYSLSLEYKNSQVSVAYKHKKIGFLLFLFLLTYFPFNPSLKFKLARLGSPLGNSCFIKGFSYRTFSRNLQTFLKTARESSLSPSLIANSWQRTWAGTFRSTLLITLPMH